MKYRIAFFWLILAALVALGCASVAREERTRAYRLEYDNEAVDEGLDSLQIEAKYFNGGNK